MNRHVLFRICDMMLQQQDEIDKLVDTLSKRLEAVEEPFYMGTLLSVGMELMKE